MKRPIQLYLCTNSAFMVRICQLALAGLLPCRVLRNAEAADVLKLSACADGILLDCSGFSREELDAILDRADRHCRIALLMDPAEKEARAREFCGQTAGHTAEGHGNPASGGREIGRRGSTRCCLNILAPTAELRAELESLFGSGGDAPDVQTPERQAAADTMTPEDIQMPEDMQAPEAMQEFHRAGRNSTRGVRARIMPSDPFTRYKRQSFMDRVKLIAQSKADILLLGESGAGKSWLAEKIYCYSGRRGNFLSESLANIAPALFESELFGTDAGAYTGAVRRMGLLEAAGDGTLFLDEIGELPLSLQSKLFSVLDRRTFRRMGSLKEQPFEGRLIFATNRNLEEAVREKSFREELWNRISMVTLRVPPLREHPSDIPALAARFAEDEGKELSEDAIETLCGYRYPGNIRELKNIVRRSCLLSRNSILESKDIDFAGSL